MRVTIILLLLVAVYAAFCLAAPKGGKKKSGASTTSGSGSGVKGGKKGGDSTSTAVERVRRAAEAGNSTAPLQGKAKGQARAAEARQNRVNKSQGKGKTQGGGKAAKRGERDLSAILFQNEVETDAAVSGKAKGQARAASAKLNRESKSQGKGKTQGGGKNSRTARDVNSVLAAGSSMVSSIGSAASSAFAKVGNLTSTATRQLRNFTRSASGSVRHQRDIQVQPFLYASPDENAQQNEPAVLTAASTSAKSDQALGSPSTPASPTLVPAPQVKYQFVNDSGIVVIGAGNDTIWTSPGSDNFTVQILPFNMSSSAMQPIISGDLNNVFQGIAEVVGERLNVLISNVVDAIARFVSRIGQNTGR